MKTRDRAPGYVSLSVAGLANAGIALFEHAPVRGKVALRGLPFDISTDSERCLLALGRDFGGSATIQVDAMARSIVFAHRLLESPILDGGPVGIPVAHVSFEYADGTEQVTTFRDRFEIAALPVRWGQLPFAAYPDGFDRLPPRYRGRFEDAGVRQTEVGQAWARSYWLWPWLNPKPDVAVMRVRVDAVGPAFVIAGLCIGTVSEHPLRLPAAQPVVVDIDAAALAKLIQAEQLEEPLDFDDHIVSPRSAVDFSIEVDRGVASFAYTLPDDAEMLMNDDLRGFGRALNPRATPAFANVVAAQTSVISIRRGDQVLGAIPWKDVMKGDEAKDGAVRIRLADPGRNWVSTEFIDADTGAPLACRANFSSPEGIPYAPHGHHNHAGNDLGTWHRDVGGDVRLGQVTYAYVDGTCEGWLPRGQVVVDAARGFEYEPLRTEVSIQPGQQHLTIALKRIRNLRQEGWYSGDTHVHFLSTLGAHLEGDGEDLSVINLLTSQWGHLFTNTEEFTGQPSISKSRQTIVYASQENRQHVLGHLTLLGLKRSVMPWCTDGAEEAELGGTLEASMSEWADRCHEQGGLVVLPHMPNPNGEPASLIATGRADGVEFLEPTRYNHLEYYRYLNGGYRLPLVGGTDKMSADVPVGLCRTFVNIGPDEDFNYENWCKNLARGRTFVSTGPLVSLIVDGATPGDTLRVRAGATVEVQVNASSIFPIHCIELVHQGDVIEATEAPAGARQLSLKASLTVTADSWLAARVGGRGYFDFLSHRDLWGRGVMAHTSPVYVTCGDAYDVFSSATAEYMLTLIEGSLTYIHNLSTQYPEGHATHHHGKRDHIAHLSEPFEQARDLLMRRLATSGRWN